MTSFIPIVSVLTPAYNRCSTLKTLFDSLKNQDCHQFEWIIVDDGSTDDTENSIHIFKNNCNFKITYIKQINAGKHIALNEGIKICQGELTFIVDSDDYLTKDAISTIINDWKRYKRKDICGLSYLRGYSEQKNIGLLFPENGLISNFTDIRINQNIYGDKAEVWRTDVLLNYPFPKFADEKFLGEACVWVTIAKKYNMIFFNKIIYICNYLDGGLSLSGRKLRIHCPLGGMHHAESLMDSKIKLKIRIKNSWLYICYGLFAKKSMVAIIKSTKHKFLISLNLPFGFILYLIWKKYY